VDCYPALSEGAAINTLKMVFPEGAELTTKPRKPLFKSCYIAIRDDSLEKHMLSFVLFSEPLAEEAVRAFNLNNFKLSEQVFADKVLGLVSKHHDNYAAEKLLRYILDYITRAAVSVPVEVGPGSASASSATSSTRSSSSSTTRPSSGRCRTRPSRSGPARRSESRTRLACPASA
jgi:hypothetical protein